MVSSVCQSLHFISLLHLLCMISLHTHPWFGVSQVLPSRFPLFSRPPLPLARPPPVFFLAVSHSLFPPFSPSLGRNLFYLIFSVISSSFFFFLFLANLLSFFSLSPFPLSLSPFPTYISAFTICYTLSLWGYFIFPPV